MKESKESAIYIEDKLMEIYNRDHPPLQEEILKVVKKANDVLINEDAEIRPYAVNALPGGLVLLNHNIDTIIVPDIHARLDFILSILFNKSEDGYTYLEKLACNQLQIVCIGDGMHSEARAAKRWIAAMNEFQDEFAVHNNMDEEMRESLGVMEMVMEIKSTYPNNFHFLKGNHENIANEYGNGNYPFMKFSYESSMVTLYIEKFYGSAFLEHYYQFEKNLPLLAVGKNFLISHAEPVQFFYRDEVINYRYYPEVIEGLTWTDDNAADEGSVFDMINYYIDAQYHNKSYYFGGHRPIMSLYNTQANGKYIQIHNPDKFIIAKINHIRDIDLDEDILELDNIVNKIIYNENS